MSPTNQPPRPLSTAAALGGALGALATLVICMSLGLTAWFLADAGAHGDTTDALRVGADGWLMGHGSRLVLTGLPLGITPLVLTLLLLIGSFRAGRWSARRADEVSDDRLLAGAVATYTGAYLVVAVVVCIVAGQDGATPGLGRTVLGALLVASLAGGLGLVVGTGRLEGWVAEVPEWARRLGGGAVVGALTLLAAGGVLVAVSLVLSFNDAANVYSTLKLSTGEALTYTFVLVLLAPNLALLGSSYLIGPGFAFGVGSTVSPQAVSLGAMPAIPVLAALPDDGPPAGWLVALLVVPALCGAAGVVAANRSSEPMPLDLAALRGAGSGFLAGVLITVAIACAGGPLGTDRLSEIGAPVASVLGYATVAMGLGGLVGGFIQAWWQRRRTA